MQTPRQFADFNNIHHGAHGWVFGKGPGLDKARGCYFRNMNGPRFCVNESVLCVPYSDPTYWMAIDGQPLNRILRGVDPRCVGLLREGLLPNLPDQGIVPYFGLVDYRFAVTMTREGMTASRTLACQDGTLTPLIHFAWYTGCTTLSLVGFEGVGGYAQCILDLGLANCSRDFTFIRNGGEWLGEKLGMKIEIWKDGK